MRVAALALLAIASVPPLAAAHEEPGRDGVHLELGRCSIRASDGDRIARAGDLVVEAGERTKDAVALRGDVVVRAGATVEDAIAVGGDVVVEPGALVRGSALAVNGDVRVARDARVDGDAFSLGGKLRVSRGGLVAGETGTLSATWGGAALAAVLASGIADELTCAELEGDPDVDLELR